MWVVSIQTTTAAKSNSNSLYCLQRLGVSLSNNTEGGIPCLALGALFDNL